MRYLSTRDVFLKNFKELQLDIHKEAILSYNEDEMINEAFENDITWGGSLLGRLINSAIRKAKIQYNYYRVKSIARKIEDELMGLIGDNLTDEQKIAVKTITAKFILLSMYQLVFDLNDKNEPLPDNKKVSEKDKIAYLLGDKELKLNGVTVKSGNKGLINSAREYIESAPDDMKIGNDGKSELLSKLKEFEDSLQELKKYYDQREELVNDVKELLDLTNTINEDYSVQDDEEEEEEEETKPEEKTGLTKDKLVVGNWYKYTTKENKIWLVKLINKDYTVQYGSDKSWGSKDDVINTTSKLPEDAEKNIHNVYVVQQTTPGEKYTGQLRPTGIGVSVSQLEELPEQPKAAAAAPTPAKKLTKDDIKVGNMYHYTKDGIKKIVKVLSKDFQIDIKTNKQIAKLSDDNTVFVGLVGKDGKTITTTYPAKVDILNERKILPNFDKFFQNYLLEDAIPVDTERVGKIKKDLDKEEAEYDDEETLANREVENKIKKDLEGLDVETLKEFKDNPDSKFSAFGKQLNEDTKLDDLEEEVFNIAEVIKKLSSTFNANMGVLDKIKSSENIKKFVEILQKIKGFSSNKTGDLVESWNKVWGKDHENWKISDEDNKLREDVDKTKLNINIIEDGRGRDRVINIVDLFGKAYSCFATQLIPSGRPGGRVSTKTRNEYVYIGGGTEPAMTESSGPGSGPWANIKVFTKFGDEITRLLSMQKFKQVFNTGMIKTADGDKKGNALTEFIRDMIDESNLKSYTKRRADFITKYFGLNTTIKIDTSASGNETNVSKEDTDGSEIFWRQEREFNTTNLKPGCFIVMDFKHKNSNNKIVETIIMGEILGIREGKLSFKFQKGAYAIPNSYNPGGYNLPTEAKFGLDLNEKRKVYFGLMDLPLNTQSKKIANMVFFDSQDENTIKKMTIQIFRPAGSAKSGKPSRTKDREGLGVLYIYKENEGEKMMINKEPGKANVSKIPNDKSFDSDRIYNKLSSQVGGDLPSKLEGDDVKILKADF